jgi:sulfofructose kinase
MATVFCVGHAVQDYVYSLPALPTRAEKHFATGFMSVGGGPAATAAVAIARLGGHAVLAARVGDDTVADAILSELAGSGVDCSHVRRFAGRGSSVSAVIVDPAGERLIVNHLDRAMPSAADWLPEPTSLGAAAVLADTRWPEGAARALAAARAAGLPAVLDADRPMPRDGVAIGAATHVAFSAEALAELTGEVDPVRGLKRAGAGSSAWCCVTVGAAGVHVLERGLVAHFPAFVVPVVDTLGAGDVWHGAFALGLAEGMDTTQAVHFASAAAALKVQGAGGRASAPKRKEVDDFMIQHGARAATARD